MKREIELYVLFMAITLPIQYLAYAFLPEFSLSAVFSNQETIENLPQVIEHYSYLYFASVAAYILPGLATSIWLLKIKSINRSYKWAWLIVGFLLEYYILLFYIVGQLIPEKKNDESLA